MKIILYVKRSSKYKKKYKNEIGLMTDVALDPYTSHGHDGLIKNKNLLNDETIDILINQSFFKLKWDVMFWHLQI